MKPIGANDALDRETTVYNIATKEPYTVTFCLAPCDIFRVRKDTVGREECVDKNLFTLTPFKTMKDRIKELLKDSK